MAETVGLDDVVRMLRGAVAAIKAKHEELSRLDAATGDGDHGSAMLRVAGAIDGAIEGAIEGALGKTEGPGLKALLHDVGWAVMAIPGGSTGPLYGSFVVGLSEGVGDGDSLDCAGVAGMLKAGQAKLRKNTRAKEGDKTLIDALAPAVKAAREAADAGRSVLDALKAAAEAAARGAEATKDMKAKFGRARNLGDRVIGHADPGATSISYVFAGLAEGLPG